MGDYSYKMIPIGKGLVRFEFPSPPAHRGPIKAWRAYFRAAAGCDVAHEQCKFMDGQLWSRQRYHVEIRRLSLCLIWLLLQS